MPHNTATRSEPWTSEQWVEHFQANANALLPVPWERGVELTEEERRIIAGSLPEFQTGEGADGRRLLAKAAAFAQQSGDVNYREAIRLFIEEEHRHSEYMGRVLDLAGIPRWPSSPLTSLFGWLRSWASMETSVMMFLSAEVCAQVYFTALRRATAEPVLRGMCDQILRDEVQHIRFQAERLALMRQGRGPVRLFVNDLMQRVAVWITGVLLWWQHGRLFRLGGFSFARFRRCCCTILRTARRQMTPVADGRAATA